MSKHPIEPDQKLKPCEMIALLFNMMPTKQKMAVPEERALAISDYMTKHGYKFVFGRWYLQNTRQTNDEGGSDE